MTFSSSTELAPYRSADYCVPIPVKPAPFVSLHREHRAYAVQTDLAAIAPFAVALRAADGEALGYADLQDVPAGATGLRLGSGRAAFYRGKYLKGIGRTTLAGNWSDPNDVYHGSGHLYPSGAIREYLVSRYLAGRGEAGHIVACEGLMLMPLSAALAEFAATAFPRRRLRPIDRRFQALTVKRAEFTRHSNLTWSLNHLRPGYLGRFFRALGLDGASPAELACALASSATAGLPHFAAFTRAGVYWGSFGNNFTLDGRFLDLEMPLVIGAPMFGVVARSARLGRDAVRNCANLVGAEGMHYVEQASAFVAFVHQRLRYLLDVRAFASPIERAFAAEFVEALGAELGPDYPAARRIAGAVSVADTLASEFELAPRDRVSLRDAVRAYAFALAGEGESDLRGLRFRPLPMQLARVESFCRFHAFAWARLPPPQPCEAARTLNRALDRIDAMTDLERILVEVERVARELDPDERLSASDGRVAAAESVPGASAHRATATRRLPARRN